MMRKIKLKELVSFNKGQQINGNELLSEGRYDYLNGGINPSGKWNNYNVEGNTIAISEGGNSCGYVNYMNQNFWCGAHCYYLFDIKCNVKYLFYNLKYNERRLQNIRSGACMPNIKKKDLGDFEIFIDDDINIQSKIVSYLDSISYIIQNRKKQIDLLDELIKSQFVEMFGDIKLNNKGWHVIDKIGNVCVLNPKKSEIESIDNIEVSFIPMQNVSEKGYINANEVRLLNDVKKGFTYFRENDILFAKITPCMENGKGAVAKGLKNNIGFGSTEFHVIRPTDRVNSIWLYIYTTFKSFRSEAERKMTGSAGQKRVPIKFLDNYEIAIPPIDLQNKFANFVKQADKMKIQIENSLKQMEELYDSLMENYFG